MWSGEPVPIGRELVDRDFASRYNGGDWSSMSTAVDPVNSVVMWAMADRIYCYNWILQRWTIIPLEAEIIFSGVTKGVTLDETDPDVGALDDDLDGAGLLSFDNFKFKGGDPQLYLFNSSHEMGTLSGTPMTATFTSSELELFRGRRACLRLAAVDLPIFSVPAILPTSFMAGEKPPLNISLRASCPCFIASAVCRSSVNVIFSAISSLFHQIGYLLSHISRA